MTKAILKLYELMNENKETVLKIGELNESDFILNREYLEYGYGLIKEICELFTKIDNIILLSNRFIETKSKQLPFINDYLLNNYKLINGYLVYDFFVKEYLDILNQIEIILNI